MTTKDELKTRLLREHLDRQARMNVGFDTGEGPILIAFVGAALAIAACIWLATNTLGPENFMWFNVVSVSSVAIILFAAWWLKVQRDKEFKKYSARYEEERRALYKSFGEPM